jgi:hypothetical protein
MFTSFTLQFAVGLGFRLALAYAFRARFDLTLAAPQGIKVLLRSCWQ